MKKFYCPNFSLPQTKQDFAQLSNIVGEDYAYYLWNKNKGLPLYLTEKNGKEVSNEIYENLLKAFNGNVVATTQAFILQNSSAFKKQNKDFNNLNAKEQAEAIHKYVFSSETNLEDLSNTLASNLPTGFRAEFYQSGGFTQDAISIDRKTIRGIEKEVKEQTETSEEIIENSTGREQLEAILFARKNPVLNKVDLINLQRTIGEGKFAEWTKNAITLYQGSDFTDLYHESWHEFTQRYLTKVEKLALYNAVKSRPGSVEINGKQFPHYALTNRQAEEILAEEFRTFALNRNATQKEVDLANVGNPKTELSVKRIFDKIFNFFKSFFSSSPEQLDKNTPLADNNVNQLFVDLYEGNVGKYKVSDSNITEAALQRSTKEVELSYHVDGENLTQEISSLEMAEVFGAIDFWLREEIENKNLNISFLLNDTLKNKYLPQIYNNVKNKFELYVSQLNKEGLEAETEGDEILANILANRRLTIQWILANSSAGDNWEKVITLHQNQSKNGVLKLNSNLDANNKLNSDTDQRDSDNYDETEGVRKQENWDDVSVNPEELVSPTILEIVRMLPNVDKNNKPIYSTELGLPTVSDYKANKNLLFNRLTGIQQYSETINVLKGLLPYAPQFKFLIDQLPDPNKEILTQEELSLKAQFMQSFTMSTVDPYTVKLVQKPTQRDEGVRMQTSTFYQNSLTTDTLLEYFDQDFRENIDRRFRTVTNEFETAKFDIVNAYNTIMSRGTGGISTDRDHIEFYRDMFGVDLIQGNEDIMFNRKGDYIPNSVPYINQLTLQNLKNLARHSFRKLSLIYLITVESNRPDYPKVPKSLKDEVSALIESPFTYFATDIKKSLISEIEKLADNHPIKKYFKDNFKQTTTFSERKYVFDSISFIYNSMSSSSYLNAANDLEWSIKDRNHMLSVKERINTAKTIDQLPSYLNPVNFPFAKYSVMYSKLFGEDGKKLISQDGQETNIQILNFAGFTVGRLDGQKTTNLTGDDKFNQDLLAFLQDGVFENIRFGSKSSSYATTVGNNKKERLYYQSEDFLNLDQDQILPSSVISQFVKYLRFEVERVNLNKEGKTQKEKLGSRLFLFRDILDKATILQIETLAKNAATPEQAVSEFKKFYRDKENANKINGMLENYFKVEVDRHKQILANVLTAGDVSKVGDALSRLTDKSKPYSENEINKLFTYYLTNYMSHQFEFTNIFVGDVSNYNIKPKDLEANNFREVFKRLGLASSPGKEPLIDDQDLRSRNSNDIQGRLIENIFGNGARPYTKDYNVAISKDVKSFDPLNNKSKESDEIKQILKEEYINNYAQYLAASEGKKKVTSKHLEKAEEEIGENVDTFLNQDKESDAQAYATIDFVRFYLDSIGEWSPDLEAAYLHEVEVAKAIKEYRRNSTPENRANVESLIDQANKGILTSLKLGHYSEVSSKQDEIFNGKYSVFPLSPSAVFDTDQEKRMIDMYEKGIDFITPISGVKMSIPAPMFDTYRESENAYEINPIPEESVFSLPMNGLRRQQYIAPKFKNKSTLSTQLVKLLFSNFFVNGDFNSELIGIKGLQEKINKAQGNFIESLELLVENEKNKIYLNIGAELDADGNLISIDYNKFEKWLKSEFDKKDVSPSLYTFVKSGQDGFRFSLDASPQRSVLEGLISSVINKRILRPELNGEAYIQLASTGFNSINSRYRKLDKKEYKKTINKYGLTGLLQDYRIEDSVTQPADVAISFNPKKHSGLLEIEFEGERIGTITKLNQILLADTETKKQWLKDNNDKLTIVGVRIPVQGFNSMEYFRVKKFLPTVSGPVIIVPPSIVTKSGSDFDIDKLFMYEPSLDENGNIIDESFDVTDKGGLLEKTTNRSKAIQSIKNLKDLLSPYKNYAAQVSGIYKDLRQEYIDILNNLETETDKSSSPDFYDDFEDTAVQLMLKIKMLTAKIKQTYGEYYKDNKALKPFVDNLNNAYNQLETYKKYSNKVIKASATNSLISSFKDVLSEPALYKFLTKPNDSNILRTLADRYLPLKSVENKVTSTSMFLPRISLAIYEENALGKKALGIDAKTNALHKLFQQVGLRFTDPFLNDFYLIKSNKYKNQIVLGGLKDADSNNYISDIINEFINGHVDIEKEDWINYFNADKTRTSIILQMVLNGTPIEDAIILVNQPIVQNYIVNSRRSKIKTGLAIEIPKIEDFYKKILSSVGLKPIYSLGGFNEEATIKMILSSSFSTETINLFNSGRNENLKKDNFVPEVNTIAKPYEDIVEKLNSTSDVERAAAQVKIRQQLALFTQYRIAYLQNQKLLNLTSVIDYNTSKYRTISDFYGVQKAINDSKEFFNVEALDKISNNSVVSPFNVVSEALDLYSGMFDIAAHPEIQSNIEDFLENYGSYWDSDTTSVEVSNFLNGLVHAIIQYKGQDGTTAWHGEYGPSSDYLTKGYNPNKSLDIQLDKLKGLNDLDLNKFMEVNLLFKNLSYSEILDSGISRVHIDGTTQKKKYNKMYFKVRTNEKDPDTIGAIQKAWLDAYNYSYSTPEVNQMVRDFASNLANATIYGQGYSIKYRSLQPFIPISLLQIDGALGYIKELKEALKSNNMETIAKFKSEIFEPFIQEYTIKYDRYRRKNYTVYKRYFPDFVKKADKQFKGTINISAASKGFSARLTNPTELAVYRKNLPEGKPLTKYEKKYKYITFYIGGKLVSKPTLEATALYPIEYKGKLYADVEAAYQEYKKPYLITKTTEKLMKELLVKKLSTYPDLVTGIYSRGGNEYLDSVVHRVKGDKFWESDGENMFIKTLTEAYEEVLPSVNVEDVAETEVSMEEYDNYFPSDDYSPEVSPFEEETVTDVLKEREDELFEQTEQEAPSVSAEEGLLAQRRKKKSQSKVDEVLTNNTPEVLKNLSVKEFESLGLSPQEISELMSKLC